MSPERVTMSQEDAAEISTTRRLSLESASYVPTSADRDEQKLMCELRDSMNLTTRANLVETQWGTRFEAPFDASAVDMLRTIGAQWNRDERVWMVKSDRHHLALRIAFYCYDSVGEYVEHDSEISAVYPDAD